MRIAGGSAVNGVRAVGAKHTLLLQEPHDLAQEQRISLGLVVEGLAASQPAASSRSRRR